MASRLPELLAGHFADNPSILRSMKAKAEWSRCQMDLILSI